LGLQLLHFQEQITIAITAFWMTVAIDVAVARELEE